MQPRRHAYAVYVTIDSPTHAQEARMYRLAAEYVSYLAFTYETTRSSHGSRTRMLSFAYRTLPTRPSAWIRHFDPDAEPNVRLVPLHRPHVYPTFRWFHRRATRGSFPSTCEFGTPLRVGRPKRESTRSILDPSGRSNPSSFDPGPPPTSTSSDLLDTLLNTRPIPSGAVPIPPPRPRHDLAHIERERMRQAAEEWASLHADLGRNAWGSRGSPTSTTRTGSRDDDDDDDRTIHLVDP